MLPAGASYENPKSGARVEVIEMTPEVLRFERLYKPHTGRAGAHLHRDFTQSWELISGRGRFELDGKKLDLAPGESAEIALEQPHRDLFNPFDEDAVARFRLEPCNKFVETFFETLAWLFKRGKLDDQDGFAQLQLFVILHATNAQSFAAGPPIAVQKAILPIAAWIGKLRGYQARYE
jgi:Mannose-6-phosphate isomerase